MSMFQAEVEDGGSFLAFLLQQVGVCLASILWGGFAADWLARLSKLGPAGSVAEGAFNVALALGPAFLFGRLLRSRLPHAAYSGRWVWLLPSALFVIALLSSVFHSMLASDLTDLLFPPDAGDTLWAVVFFSYPTFGSVGYSLGIWFRHWRLADE